MGAARCPYCHDVLEKPDLPLTSCEGCGTRFHRICLEELGRCATLGCSDAGVREERRSVDDLLLHALIQLQDHATDGTFAPTEVLAEVEHLCSLLPPEQVEQVRERARKVSPYEKVVERSRLIQQQEDRERNEYVQRAFPRPTPPCSLAEAVTLGVLLLILLLVKILL